MSPGHRIMSLRRQSEDFVEKGNEQKDPTCSNEDQDLLKAKTKETDKQKSTILWNPDFQMYTKGNVRS